MYLESIKIQHYKVFKNLKIDNLPKLITIIGLNGVGKSTFFDIFSFLSDCLKDNVTIALSLRGGFNEVITRELDPHKNSILIELKFRTPENFKNKHAPIITYTLEIIQNTENKIIVHKELLKYRRGRKGKPWHFIDFSDGEGESIANEDKYEDENSTEQKEFQKLASPDILAIKGLGQFEKYKVISTFRNMLENWYICNFKIESGRQVTDYHFAKHLSKEGENLAQVTKYYYDNYRTVFNDILKKLPQRIPGINEVVAHQTDDGRILLKFKDENFTQPFIQRYVSDGTLKMFAYMILLNDPAPHPLISIEEPENYLHPDLLPTLVDEIKEYANKGGQVFISSHSPDFINNLDIENVFILSKMNGITKIEKLSDNKKIKALSKDNKLGYLWQNKYLQNIKGANL